MSHFQNCITSSIGKKQIVATTGLLLIIYVVLHLTGNLFIYAGPEAFNGWAAKLHSLGPILRVFEYGLLFTFLIHIYFTYLVVLENMQARGVPYAISKPVGERSLATRLMPYTGTFLFAFVIWHLLDFTFIDHNGPRSMMNGISMGLYGVVYNAFRNQLHSGLYIMAMGCLGFHLAHGIQSVFQTFGFNHPRYTPLIIEMSDFLGLVIAFSYSTIPILVLLHNARYKVGM